MHRRIEYFSKIETVNLVIKKLTELRKDVRTFDDYVRSWVTKDATERNLHKAIEAIIDIGKMIIADRGLRIPENNREVFLILSEKGLFPSQYLGVINRMIGMRNVLIHGYDRVDDSIIYGILKRHLKDIKNILEFLKVQIPKGNQK